MHNDLKRAVEVLKDGGIILYPTDTIWGIGCDATNKEAVRKIRDIKKSEQPFSVIAPGKKWIMDNCVVHEHANEYLEKLPGPYTLIFKLKKTALRQRIDSHCQNGIARFSTILIGL